MEKDEENTNDSSYYYGSVIIISFSGGRFMTKELELLEDTAAYKLAAQLSNELKNSKEYIYYTECLEELKKDSMLYQAVCDLRRENFQMQNSDSNCVNYEQYSMLSAKNTNLRKNPVVSRFINAEIGMGRLITDIFRQIVDGVEMDIDFLED